MVNGMVVIQCRSAVALEQSSFRGTPQYFYVSPLSVEFMTAFSGQTDAPKVRCDLTDRQTDTHTHTHTHTHDHCNHRDVCELRVNKKQAVRFVNSSCICTYIQSTHQLQWLIELATSRVLHFQLHMATMQVAYAKLTFSPHYQVHSHYPHQVHISLFHSLDTI